jgi:hypothetical protein
MLSLDHPLDQPLRIPPPLQNTPSLRKVILRYLASNITVLIFTGIPLFLDTPLVFNSSYYSGDDLLRILEPIISLAIPSSREQGIDFISFYSLLRFSCYVWNWSGCVPQSTDGPQSTTKKIWTQVFLFLPSSSSFIQRKEPFEYD